MQKLFKKVIHRSKPRWVIGFSVAALLVCASFGQVSTGKVENKNQGSTPSHDRVNLAQVQKGLLNGPVAFEANRGQTDGKVKFLTRAQNFTVFLTPGETILRGRNQDVLRMKLQNANPSPNVVGESRMPRVSNYYIGSDRSKWLTGVPNYGQVRYRDVYAGVDMVYHSDQEKLEYDFVVKPGADAGQIQVAFEGAGKMSINKQGELELHSAAGNTVNHKPVVYQMIDGHRKMVDGEYALASNTVGFKIGEYDHSQPLVIDPTLQVLSFFGGTLNDEASGVAANATLSTGVGVVFVGRAESPALPTGGTAKPSTGINWDAFAVGLNGGQAGIPAGAGTSVLWTTYFGGSGDDAARGVAMDNAGNSYVVGYTNSSNFPSASSPAASYDAFVTKLSSGGGISATTLYGGPFADQANAIALDFSTFSTLANASSITNPATDPSVVPNIVIGGFTNGSIGMSGSPTASIGKLPDGNQITFNNCASGTGPGCGNTDGFVATFTNALVLLHATYIGGGGNDQVNGVAADIWGNIYATGYATPNVAPFFPVVNGIGVRAGTQSSTFDAAQNPQNTATAFVAKWACTTTVTANNPIGVPSPPFGVGASGVNSQFPICGGGNNLKTLSNSALFGGSAAGNTFVNPQQTAQFGTGAGITEAGMGIAVDMNGWGQAGVAGQNTTNNATGFPDIIPNSESNGACNGGAVGNVTGLGAPRCAVSLTGGTQPTPPGNNAATNVGGFQPGLSGPHVYIVGTTASRNFVNSLVNASCTRAPGVSSTGVSALCPTPEVWGGAVTAAAGLPVPFCDSGAAPAAYANACPGTVVPADIRVKMVAGNTANSGQTQGWLASFQFPAVTQAIVQPSGATTPTTVTTLAPPTIPNYVVLQPATCPQQIPACLNGGLNTGGASGTVLTTDAAPAANLGCTVGGTGVTCPTTFIGSWNAVAVDSDQQVYTIGQVGMIGAAATFNAGPPTRLALEIERITPYANTTGSGFTPNLCPGGTQFPCAFPETLFPTPTAPVTSSFLVDVATTGSAYGQILPGAPPSPDPNQPGGLGNGIAVNPLREAFFVGTSNATTPSLTGGVTATATATIVGGAVQITLTTAGLPTATSGSGYLTAPTITLTGLTGCTTAPGPFTVTIDPITGAVTAVTPNPSGAGCTVPAPTVAFSAAPAAGTAKSTNYLTISPIESPVSPVPATQANLSSTVGAQNGGREDVIYGAMQFYDAIATPSALNFTATVNSLPSITAPNGQTGGPTGLAAQAIVNYSNWESQVLNIPPGCTISPVVPNGQGGAPAFLVTPITGTSSFLIQVNPSAVAFPGVVTSIISFNKVGPCTGVGQPPLDSWDPITVTLTVSAPISLSPENTFVLTSGTGTGLVQPLVSQGLQLVANQFITSGIDVSTTNSNGPINFTAQIVPGPNWIGAVANSIVLPTPTDIIYTAVGSNLGAPTRIPVGINTQVIASLPAGTYTAYIMFTASPETPATPTAGSTACGITSTVPVGSGTTSPSCIPISLTITGVQTANIPSPIVFGANSATNQQTGLVISNPLGATSAFNFTTGYQPTPVVGTALPAANVFFVGTGSTLIPATVGNTISGSIAAGGTFTVPIQVNPVGLKTGVYSGQLLVSNNGQASGATPQTTVPLIVYVGPQAGEDLPSGNGLGLMLPVNLPPIGTGALPGTAAGSSPGAYSLTLSVPAGVGPTGANAISNPTLVQVTGLNNTSLTPYVVKAPTVSASLVGVSVTNPGFGFGTIPGQAGGGTATCATNAQQSALPNSPIGSTCAWSVWVDATSLNSTNTQQLAACGSAPDNFGETGTLTFSSDPTGQPFANLVVPVTVCVTDFPRLTVAMPTTFPNPTFGTGLPTNVIPGFTQSVVEMALPSTGVTLLTTAGNSSQVCKVLDIHSNGGIVSNVTIAPLSTQWVTIQPAPPLFTGTIPAFSNPGTVNGLTPINSAFSQFAAGPLTVGPGLQTFQICVNTDPVGNVAGIFSTTVTINGAGVGPIVIPVNMLISGGIPSSPLSQIGVYRPTATGPNTSMAFYLDANGNNAWDATDKVRLFGVTGIPGTTLNDTPVAGDWDGSGIVRFGVFHCPATPAIGPCTWFIDLNNNGQWDGTFGGDAIWSNFGLPGDIPVVGDWTGDGKAKIGVIRCSAGPNPCVWYLDMGNKHTFDPATVGILFLGASGDMPAVGNWLPNSTSSAMQIGVAHCPTAGAACTWTVDSTGKTASANPTPIDVRPTATTAGTFTAPGGFQTGDVAVMGNWNGNGKLRMGIFRASTGQWFVDTNGNGVYDAGIDQVFSFGLPPAANPGGVADQPIVGFWTVQ